MNTLGKKGHFFLNADFILKRIKYQKATGVQLAKDLGCSKATIYNHLRQFREEGLLPPKKDMSKYHPNHNLTWTLGEDEYLKKHFHNTPFPVMEVELGRTIVSIKTRASELRISSHDNPRAREPKTW